VSVTQYTAEELISIIRTRGGIPDASSEGTQDTDFLSYLNTEALGLYGEIASSHENYFVMRDRVALVAGKQSYRIPHRAMFQKIRDLMGVDSTGTLYTIEIISREKIADFQPLNPLTTPRAAYIENNNIVFLPSLPVVDGSVDISYLFRPGQLVLSTDCRKVKAIANAGTGQIQLDSAIPAAWTTSVKYDVHSAYSGAEPKAWSLPASAVGSDTLTLGASAIDGSTFGRYAVEVGDWVALEEQAALPGIPRELHPILAQAVICRFLERKDKEAYQISRAELTNMLERVKVAMAMRSEGRDSLLDTGGIFFGR
jgi:hypothetical protein